MGCCLSTTRPTKLPESDVKGGASSPDALVLEEEETVKEVVISETQTPITCIPKIPIKHNTPTLTNTINSVTTKLQLEPNDRLKEPVVEEQEEISAVSEMYSISGSFSTSTVNDGEEASGEVNQRMIHHSPAKTVRCDSRVISRAKYGRRLRSLESSDSREITRGHRSSAPPSCQVKSRPVQGRTVPTVQRRNVGRRDRDWQGLVGYSGERLGSRAAAVSEVIREPRTVPSVTRNLNVRSRVRKLEAESKRIENHDGAVSRESLDNPRVSLECFIFL